MVREIPVIPHELMRAALGHPVTVRSLDGEQFLLRLPTAEEVQRFQQESFAVLAEQGVEVDLPPISRERAQDLCAPLDPAKFPTPSR